MTTDDDHLTLEEFVARGQAAQRAADAAIAAATCGATSGALRCDREPGHAGDHRGYLVEQDTPVFWRRFA